MKLLRLAILVVVSFSSGCSSPTPSPSPEPVGGTPEADATVVAPQPRPPANGEATLFLMADIRGVLRPCGCTVDLQKGGFDRLIPYLAEERKRFQSASLLHAGPLFYEEAIVDAKKKAQMERQTVVAADLVARTKFDVAGATVTDEVASGGRLAALGERAKVELTAANLKFQGLPAESSAIRPRVVKEIGGLRIGIFALASSEKAEALAGKVVVGDPEAAAVEAVAAFAGNADVVVLLSDLGLRETKRLVRKVPGIDFVVAGGMGEHPSVADEAEAVGATRVLQFHREGRYLGRLTMKMVAGSRDFIDASAVSAGELAALDERIKKLEAALAELTKTKGPEDKAVRSAEHHLGAIRSERERLATKQVTAPVDRSSFSFTQTPLNWDLPQEPDVLAIMKAFDEELAKINVANAGTLPEPAPGEAVYAGTDACFECHAETKEFWRTTPHSHAWETLVDAGKTFDTDCVSCHVTGYGKAGGSLIGKTAGREDVQCEACHGPGSKHVEDGGELETIIGKPTAEVCTVCHNQHHSPKFAFGSFRQELIVPGHGKPLK